MTQTSNLMTGSPLYALYGSLRRGMSNHRHFAHAMEFVEVVTISGFRMYALRHYPYVVETGNERDKIIAELTRITDPAVEYEMNQFEASVGYQLKKLPVAGRQAGIFVFPSAGDHPIVQGGDWVAFFKR